MSGAADLLGTITRQKARIVELGGTVMGGTLSSTLRTPWAEACCSFESARRW